MKKRILISCITVISLVLLMAFITSVSAFEFVAKSSTTVEITKYTIDSNVVTIPDTTTTGKRVVSIAPGAFVYTDGEYTVDTLKIGAYVTNISDGVFASFDSLGTIEVSENNTKFKAVDNVLFSYDMKTLIKYAAKKSDAEYTVPESVITISANAFEGCTKLESLTLGGKLKTIGNNAFENCKALKEITLPVTVTSIGEYAFSACYSLEEITVPATVKTIKKATFYSCTGLKKVVLQKGVQIIEDDAFYGASSLADITLPDSITKIGSGALAGTAAYNGALDEGCLYIGAHLIRVDEGYSGRLRIKSGTLTIAHGALDPVLGITELLLPQSLRSVPKGAILNKDALEFVVAAGYNTVFEKDSFYPGENFDRIYFCKNSGAHDYFQNQLSLIGRRATFYSYISDDFRLTIDKGLSNAGAITLGFEDVDEAELPASVVTKFDGGDMAAYSISLTRAGKAINPGSNVTYSMELPASFRSKAVHIYYLNAKNELVWLNATYNAEKVTFTTNKTGTFIIGRSSLPGDVNNDFYVNSMDMVMLAQYIAKWYVPRIDLLAADGNCDGVINSKDVVLLAQYVANWAVVFGTVQPEGFPYEFVAFDPYKTEYYLDQNEVMTVRSALTGGTGEYEEIKIASIDGQSLENLPYEAFCNYMDALHKDKVTPEHYAEFFDIEKRETARTKDLYKKVFKATAIEFFREAIGEEGYVPGVFAVEAVNDDGSLVLASDGVLGDYNEILLRDYKPSSSTVYTFIAADGIYVYRGKPRTNHTIEVSDSASVICYGQQMVICDLSKNVDEIAIGTYDFTTTYINEELKTQYRSHKDTWYLK